MGIDYSVIVACGFRQKGDEPDEFQMPWDNDKHDRDPDDWWIEVNRVLEKDGAPRYPYTEEGEHKEGMTEAEVDRYWDWRKAWLKENPIPFEVEQYGHYNYGYTFIALKGAVTAADIYKPRKIDEALFEIQRTEELDELREICKKYEIPIDEDGGWYILGHVW